MSRKSWSTKERLGLLNQKKIRVTWKDSSKARAVWNEKAQMGKSESFYIKSTNRNADDSDVKPENLEGKTPLTGSDNNDGAC